MVSAEVINISDLVQPISEDSATGMNIREDSSIDSTYYSVKDARNSARAAERKNVFEGNNSEADEFWRKIIELSPNILQSQTKDLEIACWYTEALVRKHGFQGLRDGLSIINQLIEQYWENLYPLPDEEDGMEMRVAPLTGLNGEGAEGVLIAPIRNINITDDVEPGPFNIWQYQQALDLNKITDEEARQAQINKKGFGLEDIERAVNASSETFFISLRADIQACIKEFTSICEMLNDHCGIHDAPPSSNIQNTLQESLRLVNHLGKHKFPNIEDETESTSDDTNRTEETPGISTGPITNREAAFRQISEVASFFRRTEPHSPISYILEKSLRWGDMPLHELMQELIPDSSSRDHYSSLTGVRTDDD